MRIYSNSFFHYTKNFDALKSIIQHGIRVYFCKEAIYSEDNRTSYIGIPMVCFCDIPLSHLTEIKYAKTHVGIGLKRTWGIDHELQPVFYYPNNCKCQSTKIIIDANKAFFDNKSAYKEYRILGSAKPLYDLDNSRDCNYKDREWRKIYESRGPLQWKTEAEYQDFIKNNPSLYKRHIGSPLKFGVDDIDFIIVGEQDIHELHKFVMRISRIGGKELVEVTQQDKELLLSKIIAYETLERNI